MDTNNTFEDVATIRRWIRAREGYTGTPYLCSLGHWTVGIGHRIPHGYNTRDYGDEEIEALFESDWNEAFSQAKVLADESHLQWDPHSRAILVGMVFQLGYAGTSRFTRLIAAMGRLHWPRVAFEALDSAWSVQTPIRARDAAMIAINAHCRRNPFHKVMA